MKRLLTLALSLVALLSLSPSAVGADAEEFNAFEPDQLEANGWEERTGTTGWFGSGEDMSSWCKSADQVNENDQATLSLDQEPVQEALGELLGKLNHTYNLENPEQGAIYCVDPEASEAEEEFLCLIPDHANLPEPTGGGVDSDASPISYKACWDSNGEYVQGWFDDTVDTISDPVGTMVDSTLGQWITELIQGLRFYMAMALYWWIMIPHADIEQSPAGTLWPPMLGLSMAIGIALLAFKGIKIMFSSKAVSVLVDTLKGIASFAVWCIIGIALISQLGHASEALTQGLLKYSLDASQIGCSRYHAEERQPDGMEIEYPSVEEVVNDRAGDEEEERRQAEEERVRTASETGRALGNCFAAQFAVSGMFGGAIMVLFILGFLMSIVQAIILFIREAVLPILALLLPIAAAGQVGGTATKRWLPNLLSAIVMMLLYKPMIALIFAVGFTTASLGNEFIDVIRGLVVLLVGVVAPGVMLKAFKPIATQGVEDMASVGSTVNNFVMGSQASSTLSGWARNIGAGRQARHAAANQAAHQAGGVALTATKGAGAAAGAASAGAATAAGPPGWAAKAVQTVGSTARKAIGFVTGNSAGPEAQAVRRNPGAPGQHGMQPPQGGGQGPQPQQGQSGTQPPPREQAPDPTGPPAGGMPDVSPHGHPPEQAPPGMGLREGPPPPAGPGPSSGAGYGPPPAAPDAEGPPPPPPSGGAPHGPNTPPPTGPNLPPPSSNPDDRSEET